MKSYGLKFFASAHMVVNLAAGVFTAGVAAGVGAFDGADVGASDGADLGAFDGGGGVSLVVGG